VLSGRKAGGGGVRAIKENWAANGQAIISRASSTLYYTLKESVWDVSIPEEKKGKCVRV
jgi:hypothetical protein